MSDAHAWALLLDRYLAGECTPVEVLEVRRWLAEDPEAPAVIEELTAVRRRNPVVPATATEVDASLERLLAQTRARPGIGAWRRQEGVLPLRHARAPFAHRIPPMAYQAAAAVLVVIAGAAIWWPGVRGWRGGVPARTYITTAGQRENITLVDGTRITLAPSSRLQLAADFGRTRRALDLEGEAYFEVEHDATRPFTVRAGNAVTQDVGTQFDVRAYAGDGTTRIAVVEGAVAVTGGGGAARERSLQAGDVATVGGTAVAVTRGVATQAMASWRSGVLVFDDRPLREVAVDLSRWYAITVDLDDTILGARRVTATVPDQPLDVALPVIAAAVGARIERTASGYALVRPDPSHP